MINFSERLKIEANSGVSYIYVDYTGLKEKEMIALVNWHLELTVETKFPFVADFHKTYVTPGYMLHARRFVSATQNIINRGAFLGVNKVKSFILKGIVLSYKVNYQAFETKQDAVDFVTRDDASTLIQSATG
jgi:hypothetical protein